MPPKKTRRREAPDPKKIPVGFTGPPRRAADVDPTDDFERDEEEPEGEDLFGEDYLRDYEGPDLDDEGNEIVDEADEALEEFIDDDSAVSDMSDGARMKVDRMLTRRNELATELQERLKSKRLREREQAVSDTTSSDATDEEASVDGVGGATRRLPSDERSVSHLEPDGAESIGGGSIAGVNTFREYDSIFLGNADQEVDFDWTRPQCELAEWLSQEVPRRVVKNRMYHFLVNFERNGIAVYEGRIRAMTKENGQSFEVSYQHLGLVYGSVLALWLIDAPDLMLSLFEEAANYFVFRTLFPHYINVHRSIRVRIAEMSICDPIRDFRQMHMNVLVRVEGVVVRRSPTYPQLQAVKYDCGRCSFIIGPIMHRGDKEQKVSMCPSCHSKGPFRVNMALTEYRNHQTLVLQEPPGKVPPGRLPRSLEVVLTHDLIDLAKPGEEIDVTGVYKNNFDPLLNSRQGFPVFTTVLHANNVTKRTSELGRFRLPDDERLRILELAKHPNIKAKLVQSIAPSIHGRDDIKLGLLLAMLGGVPKDVGGDQTHRIRGDLNVLLVGDPGCAKSQFLKFVEKTADRAVFTTGRGSTAVGLTAAVHKDPVTGDFTLEGGALVIADRGVCLIDEFDKMSDQDRTSIHEAMEQQTISVAKAGIVTTLSARCSVVAAANPIGGRYDPSLSFESNVNMTTPILSRFDLLYVVRDEVNAELDTQLADFVCQSHRKNHPLTHQELKEAEQQKQSHLTSLRRQLVQTDDVEARAAITAEINKARQELVGDAVREDDDPRSANPLPQKLLKNYILYAKAHCTPRIVNIDGNIIARLYTELRQESKHGGIPITVRHMESIIRSAEAHARMHLREFVRDDDVTAAMALFLRCFVQTQKYSMRQSMEQRFRKYVDSDMEPQKLLHFRLKALVQQTRNFERQISGGVEPVTVFVDCSELDGVVAGINISREAVLKYYQSESFSKEFTLILDSNHNPARISHSRSF
jgi:DNA replication licensing factor MCM2